MLTIVLGVLAAFSLAMWMLTLNRVKKIRRAIDLISQNKCDDVHVPESDDVAGLAPAVNDLAESLSQRISELETHKSRLEATFLSMSDGVMILDQEGNILLVNQALTKLLNIGDASGRKPIEVIRDQEIQDLADAVLGSCGGVVSRDISILHPQEKTLMVYGSCVQRADRCDGAVLVFHDITELRKLEEIRRDFVANVSHELRTPMTNIKGYSETLLDGALDDPQVAREFVGIIQTDADRLTNLIDDLLSLARIESGQAAFDPRLQNLQVIIDQTIKNLSVQLRRKNIMLHNFVTYPVYAYADISTISQVFYNLLDNAIKYNRDGGSVTIEASSGDRETVVRISDTGMGISEEDISRIFERFYRGDKSHSRKIEGTGLGLSIVKHIIQMHGGDIRVTSRISEGSTFEIHLPKN